MATFDITLCNAAVIVTSDTCYENESKDESGQYVVEKLELLKFAKVTKLIVADEKSDITKCVESVLKDDKNVFIITVGGTGFCPRDVTPEATSVLYEKHCTGVATALHMTSLRYSPYAALSRLTAGIAGQCLIVNFPGKLKACKECFACLEGFLVHALEQVRFDAEAVRLTHLKLDEIQQSQQQSEETVTSSLNEAPKDIACSANKDSVDLHSIESELESQFSPPTEQSESTTSTEAASGSNIVSQKDSKMANCLSKLVPNESRIIGIESPWPLLDYTQALEMLGTLSFELSYHRSNIISLDSLDAAHKALGRILATDIYSKTINPPFSVSTMDGYVLNIPPSMKNMIPSITTLQAKLIGNLEVFTTLQNDPLHSSGFFCYQVNTGGRLPEKNFAVIPFETTGLLSATGMVPIRNIKLDLYVREAGIDLNHSDFLAAGTRIGPVELSLILTMGHKQVETIVRPIVGVLSTGDELIEPYDCGVIDQTQVYDSNLPLLTSLLKTRGYEVKSFGIAKDNKQDLASKISSSLEQCHILLTTGGASMGTKDYVKSVIEELGGMIHFGRVNIKPGKPVALASKVFGYQRKFIFSLPGNPVSAYVTTVVLVIPFIEYGLRIPIGEYLTKEYLGNLTKVEICRIVDTESNPSGYIFEDRLEFLRAKFLSGNMNRVEVSIKQQSSRLLSLKDCECLIMIDRSNKGLHLEVGQEYEAINLRENPLFM